MSAPLGGVCVFFRENLQLERARSDTSSVSVSILLSTFLLFGPPAAPRVGASPPGVVDLDSGAWAVVHAGQLWVCWSPGANCWRRIEFESDPGRRAHALEQLQSQISEDFGEDFIEDGNAGALDSGPERWRLGFWGPRTLWIELGEQRWRVDLGQLRARATDEPAPLRLGRPRVYACGPAGDRPAIVGGRLSWQPAPRCGLGRGETSCVAPAPARLRRPRALRLRAGLQLSSTRAWTSASDPVAGLSVAGLRLRAGFEFSVVVELGFDLAGARTQQRAQAALMRRDRVRQLPLALAVAHNPRLADSLAPLAAAEARSLQALLCGELAP